MPVFSEKRVRKTWDFRGIFVRKTWDFHAKKTGKRRDELRLMLWYNGCTVRETIPGKQGGNMENILRNRRYITIPAELFGSGLSMTALCIYGFLSSRHSLSESKGWRDSTGRVYIIYPIAELAKDVGRTRYPVMDAMSELENRGLIEIKRRGVKSVSIIYVKCPDGSPVCGKNTTSQDLSCCENSTCDVGKIQPVMLGKSDTNNRYNNRKSNYIPSQYSSPSPIYSSPNTGGRGGGRGGRTDSGMFAPIPDYENCEWYGL